MLSNDFARKHKLCEFGQAQLKLNENRELQDMWNDQQMPVAGTVLFWILSRAQVDRKRLVRCAAESVQEVLPHLGERRVEGEKLVSLVMQWCDGDGDRAAIETAGMGTLEHSKAARRNGRTTEALAWSVLGQLARSVRYLNSVHGVATAIANTAKSAGDSYDASQSRIAAVLRRTFTWSEVDAAIQADRPSTRPRKATPDETAATTRQITSGLEQLLSGYRAAVAGKQAAFGSLGKSAEKVHEFVHSGALGDKNTKLIQEELAKLLAEEDRSAAAASAPAAAPRRPRMTV